MKICIIDDDITFGFYLSKRLQRFGYFPYSVGGLCELDENELDTFSLFIVDVNLGKEDGIENIKFLKGKGFHIVISTGEINSEKLQRIEQLGIHDILLKPFTGEQINEVIISILK